MMHNKAIVLVEDNEDDEKLTLMAFEKNGIANKIIVLRDGEEALDYLFGTGPYADRDLGDKPQVIMMDLKLPKIGGLEVLKKIREDDRTKYLPVVILTSSKEDQDIIQAYNLGTNAYVRKPVDFIHFIEAIKQLGLFWLILNEYPR